jgi:hypothetical protein
MVSSASGQTLLQTPSGSPLLRGRIVTIKAEIPLFKEEKDSVVCLE